MTFAPPTVECFFMMFEKDPRDKAGGTKLTFGLQGVLGSRFFFVMFEMAAILKNLKLDETEAIATIHHIICFFIVSLGYFLQ